MGKNRPTMEVEELVQTYGSRLYAFCRRLAHIQTDTDDLYQQTFLRVLEMSRRINFDTDNNPAGFLMAVAARIWQDEQKKRFRRQRIAPVQPKPDMLDRAPDMRMTDKTVEDEQIRLRIQQIVNRLHDPLRVPVLLYYMGDLSIKEIAKALQIPQGTVKSRLHNARQQLKMEMEGMGYDEKTLFG